MQDKLTRSARGQAMPDRTVQMTAEAFENGGTTSVYWLGNAGTMVNARGTILLLDPLLMGFDMPLLVDMPLAPEQIPRVDGYLVTHADGDHFSRELLRAVQPKTASFHSTRYVAEEMQKEGVRGEGHDIGARFTVGDVAVTLTRVRHTWQQGMPEFAFRTWEEADCCGFWLDTPDGSIWCVGDSQLIPEQLSMPSPDVILFDFSDNEWHITFDGAVRLANAYPNARLLPIHWGTVDAPDGTPFNGDPAALFEAIQNPERIALLRPGERLEL